MSANLIIIGLVILIILCVLCIYSLGLSKIHNIQSKKQPQRIKFNTREWLTTNENVEIDPRNMHHANVILQAEVANRIHNHRARLINEHFINHMGNVFDHGNTIIRVLDNANDVLVAQFAVNDRLFDEELFLLNIFDNFGINTQQLRERNIEHIIADIDKDQPKQQQREEFLEKSKVHVDNPQNVHDNAINATMFQIIKRIADENTEILPSKEQIFNAITDPVAKNVINIFSNENTVAALGGMSDLEVLQLVYLRCCNPKNDKKTMITALTDNLKNCMENGNIVCVTGRVARITSTLILLDFDENNWNMKLVDDYKEEILNKTKNIIQEVATLALNTDLDKYAREYLTLEREPTDLVYTPEIIGNSEEDLVNIMKKCIIEMIDEYGTGKYNYKFQPNILEIIKMENLAVFTL